MTDCRLLYGHGGGSSPVQFSSDGEFSVAAAAAAEASWAGSVRRTVSLLRARLTRAIAYVEMCGGFMRMREM